MEKSKKFDVIIVDTNNLFYRAFYTETKKSIIEGTEFYSGGIKEALFRVKSIMNTYGKENTEYYFCFDNPDSIDNIRKIIDENYKSFRLKKSAPKGLYKSLNMFAELLFNYSDNFHLIYSKNLEADDLVNPLVKMIPENKSALLISNDLDWSRNLTEKVYWFNWKKLYSPMDFFEEFKFYPTKEKIILYKVLKGDNSDNIPVGVPYLPEEILLRILDSYTSIDKLIVDLYERILILPGQWNEKIKDKEERLRTNNRLINFIEPKVDIKESLHKGKRNETLLKHYFKLIGIPLETEFVNSEEDCFFSAKVY